MGRFNLGGQEKKPDPAQNVRDVGGNYQCQTCEERVRAAKYLPDSGELVWKCSLGHISHIEGFYI